MIARALPTIPDNVQKFRERLSWRVWTLLDVVNPDLRTRHRTREQRASGQLVIGRHSYGLPEVVAFPGETQRVRIGAFCSIADDVRIFVGGNHRPDWVSTFPFRIQFDLPGQRDDGCPASNGDIVVGNDVWIGSGARLLSGVRIGNGAVIGASAVVASDVRAYAVVVGNPAREIRRRFSDAQIDMLEALAWWDWPLQRILDSVELLCGADVDGFLDAHPGLRAAGPC